MRRALIAAALLLGVAVAFAVVRGGAARAASHAGTRITPLDRQATKRYVDAQYAYERAWQASVPAVKAGVQALQRQLEGECGGVASGSLESGGSQFEPGGGGLSARERGEANRRESERVELTDEASFAVYEAMLAPIREAAARLAHTLTSLRWSDAAITQAQHAEAKEIEWALAEPAPNVCADVRSWVSSGYTGLTQATKTLVKEAMAVSSARFSAARQAGEASVGSFENAHEKRITKKVKRIQAERRTIDVNARERLEAALGLISEEEAREIELGPPRESVAIEKGRTIAGGRFTIRALPGKSSSESGSKCPFGLQAEETLSGPHGRRSGWTQRCVSPSRRERPTVDCTEGVLTITAILPGDVRSVRLVLSNGRKVASPAAIVPKRLGGPAGFYYQALRGPTPYPVSIVEVAEGGKALRTVKLPARTHCERRPATKYPKGGIRKIATGKVPHGPKFAFTGEREPHHHTLSIAIEVAINGVARAGYTPLYGAAPGGEYLSVPEGGAPHRKPFASAVFSFCRPHEYAIVYGVVRDVKDQVLARSEGHLVRLREVRIPKSLQVPGRFAYAALKRVPRQLLLRSPSGKTVVVRRLGRRSRHARELCEGEAGG